MLLVWMGDTKIDLEPDIGNLVGRGGLFENPRLVKLLCLGEIYKVVAASRDEQIRRQMRLPIRTTSANVPCPWRGNNCKSAYATQRSTHCLTSRIGPVTYVTPFSNCRWAFVAQQRIALASGFDQYSSAPRSHSLFQ